MAIFMNTTPAAVLLGIPYRKIIDNVRGELDKRQWIIFDGDVDPEWVENLNSLLDNTKLLTLPNGERLSIPPNVRIMFEVGAGYKRQEVGCTGAEMPLRSCKRSC